ncbi:uncharacterized protein si:dkey-13m1.5 [Trichomycterus rosablanca]|uniref:uncharacterized protein si:dkey-13m1.5 n=1 Tax=Trichomycterus rosablanca TaxID=2290929 RepID=UPI002F357A29
MASNFFHHPTVFSTCTPAWTKLTTNFKMHTDQRHQSFSTTQTDSFQPFHLLSTRPRPVNVVKTAEIKKQAEKLPETTQRESYVAHKVSPVIKADTKHLGGFPTITGDRKSLFPSSSYNEDFQYRPSSPAKSTKKKFQSFMEMGDRQKIVESETTHSASFPKVVAQSRVSVKTRMPVNLGDSPEPKWTTTTSEAFKEIKPARISIQSRSKTLSFVPLGDTDAKSNQERMTSTTNRFYFSEKNHNQFPVHVDGPNLRTKSNVEFGKPKHGGMFYSTTTHDSYPQKEFAQVKPCTYPPGHVLGDQESRPAVSTVKMDYLSLNSKRNELNPVQLQQIKASHIRPQDSKCYFETTYKEHFKEHRTPI